MRRASRFISSTAALFIAGQAAAQSLELNDVPPAHNTPSPEAQAAYGQARQGHIGAAIESLRAVAKDSAKNSHYLGILLFAWRQELARQRIDPIPPVDWEMDWQRCSALIGVRGEGSVLQAALLADYYARDFLGGNEEAGKKTPRFPGPGRSPELASCWSDASEGSITVQDCIDREQSLRAKRKLPAFVCPPSEPTKTSIAKYPAVKIAD